MPRGISTGGVLEALAMLGLKIPGVKLGGRAASGVGRGVGRVFRKSPIEPFIQRHKGGKFQPYERGQWKGKVGDAGEEGKIVGKGWVGKEGMKQGGMKEGDWRIIEAILKRPRNLAKMAGAGAAAAGAYSLLPEDEIPIPEWAEDLADAEEPELADVMDIADVEELSDVPSWLRPLLAGLGAFTGYKRGGLTGGLMGGAGGYGLGELLQSNPGMYEWIRKNPEMAAMTGMLGMNALGLDKGWGGGSSDIPEYQGFTPLTYDNLGGYAPSTEVPQMQRGGITDSKLAPGRLRRFDPRLDNPTWEEGTTDEEARLLEQLIQAVREPIPFGNRDSINAQTARHRALFEKYQREQYKDQPPFGTGSKYMQRPTMAQGGISGNESGLSGLRTGLRDAIVNSIDDPNRQGVNSFVPSMLKAYDEIPKLQAGATVGGSNIPGGMTKTEGMAGIAPTPVSTPADFTPKMGDVRGPNMYDRKENWQQTQQHINPNAQWEKGYDFGKPVATQGTATIQHTGSNPNQATTTSQPTDYSGVPGVGTGYDPMTAAIGENVLEQRAGMGGLGSNMTDISLARGMAPHMAGMQNQWFNQQMGMQGFNQRERENQARFGMQRAALENQAGSNPYLSQMYGGYR